MLYKSFRRLETYEPLADGLYHIIQNCLCASVSLLYIYIWQFDCHVRNLLVMYFWLAPNITCGFSWKSWQPTAVMRGLDWAHGWQRPVTNITIAVGPYVEFILWCASSMPFTECHRCECRSLTLKYLWFIVFMVRICSSSTLCQCS